MIRFAKNYDFVEKLDLRASAARLLQNGPPRNPGKKCGCSIRTPDFRWMRCFENVFPPKGAERNSPHGGYSGGWGLAFRVYINIYIYIFFFSYFIHSPYLKKSHSYFPLIHMYISHTPCTPGVLPLGTPGLVAIAMSWTRSKLQSASGMIFVYSSRTQLCIMFYHMGLMGEYIQAGPT